MIGGVEGRAEDSLTLDAESWQKLLPAAEADALGEIDREIIFEALVAFAKESPEQGVSVEERERAEPALSADAPLLVPGTRIHVRVGSTAVDTIKRLVRVGAVFALVGGLAGLAASFSVDTVLELFEKTSRLSEEEAEVVRALLLLRKEEGRPPTETELAKALSGEAEVGELLRTLRERGVVVEKDGGWRVSF